MDDVADTELETAGTYTNGTQHDTDREEVDGDVDERDGDIEEDSPSRRRQSRQKLSPKPQRPNIMGNMPNFQTPHASELTDDRMRDVTPPEKRNEATLPSPKTPGRPFTASVRPDMINAKLYDIVPTIAAPHSTSINTITATPDMRWVFSGGGDGWIRKFNWIDTVNAKSMLTVAQRHPFVDSVTKAGVLMSYWENEEPSGKNLQAQMLVALLMLSDVVSEPKGPEEALPLSPVYSLAVHPQALWLLSGTEVGAINLQSIRHEEGKRITSLFKHNSAVSVMSLLQDNKTLLSGSWDKTILEWDLHTGQVKRDFLGSRGQISAIEIRPSSSTHIPRDTTERPALNGSISINSANAKRAMSTSSGPRTGDNLTKGEEDTAGSPSGSLFESNVDNASLFGEDDGAPNSAMAFEEDDEFSKAIASGINQQQQINGDGEADLLGTSSVSELAQATPTSASLPNGDINTTSNEQASSVRSNGLPSAKTPTSAGFGFGSNNEYAEAQDVPESTFLDAAHDGTLRIWDRRQPNPIARISPPSNVPPWCMHACWAPDGDSIYVGRRNGSVDEYSLHKALRDPVRSLKFPGGSGPVSAVRAMPNSRHLVWYVHEVFCISQFNRDLLLIM